MSYSDKLLVVIPYGNPNALHHFSYGTKEGNRTFCGRDCYGWSIARDFSGSDMESVYTCRRCLKGMTL